MLQCRLYSFPSHICCRICFVDTIRTLKSRSLDLNYISQVFRDLFEKESKLFFKRKKNILTKLIIFCVWPKTHSFCGKIIWFEDLKKFFMNHNFQFPFIAMSIVFWVERTKKFLPGISFTTDDATFTFSFLFFVFFCFECLLGGREVRFPRLTNGCHANKAIIDYQCDNKFEKNSKFLNGNDKNPFNWHCYFNK